MPYPITRVPTDDPTHRDARLEELRDYIEQRLISEYSSRNANLLLHVAVFRRSDYDEVKVFVTEAALIDDITAFLRQVEDELSSEGISIITYVRTWTGPATYAARR